MQNLYFAAVWYDEEMWVVGAHDSYCLEYLRENQVFGYDALASDCVCVLILFVF